MVNMSISNATRRVIAKSSSQGDPGEPGFLEALADTDGGQKADDAASQQADDVQSDAGLTNAPTDADQGTDLQNSAAPESAPEPDLPKSKPLGKGNVGDDAATTGKATSVVDALSLLYAANPVALASQGSADIGGPRLASDGPGTGGDQQLDAISVDSKFASAGIAQGDDTSAQEAQTLGNSAADAFRFVQAKSSAALTFAGSAADDVSQSDVSLGSADIAKSITVLDARRFPGLAAGSAAALIASSLTGDESWSSAMRAMSAQNVAPSTTGNVVNTLKIELQPDRLGSVVATMRLSGETLTIDIRVHSSEAYQQLTKDQDAMMGSLRAQGYAVDRLVVSHSYAPAPDGSTQQDGNTSTFQGQQQPGWAPNQDGQTRPQRESREKGNDLDSTVKTRSEAVSDDAAIGDRTDVYL